MRRLLSAIWMGFDLDRMLPDNIKQINQDGWDSDVARRLIDDLRDYFRKTIWLSVLFALGGLAPLLYAVLGNNQTTSSLVFNQAYSGWMVVVFACAIISLWPIPSIARQIRSFPKSVYEDLMRPLMVCTDMLTVGINIGLLLYIIPRWPTTTGLPVVIVLCAIWICVPWLAYNAESRSVLIKIRAGQLVPLLILTIVTLTSPASVRHVQWWMQREAANTLRVTNLKEITSNWETLAWFTPEGAPRVWFSDNGRMGYRLFDSPGSDPDTRQELKPVSDADIKGQIVNSLAAQKLASEQTAVLAKQRDLQERLAQLTSEFVRPGFRDAAHSKDIVALIVVDAREREDTALSDHVSAVLSRAGLRNLQSVFTATFLNSDDFKRLRFGEGARQTSFPTHNFAKHLLIIEAVTQFSRGTTESVETTVAEVTWQIRLVDPLENRIIQTAKIQERGLGFSESSAFENALVRVDSKLTDRVPAFLSKL